MSKSFVLEIMTPERVVYTGNVISITCPGAMGRFQVLVNHAPFLSQLETGELNVTNEESEIIVYALSGGISHVLRNKAMILADSVERSDEIDIRRAEQAKSRAEQRLARHDPNLDVDRAKAALLRAVNRLKIARI